MRYNASVGMQLVYSNQRHVKNKARAYNTVLLPVLCMSTC